jgi:hypothetical protein
MSVCCECCVLSGRGICVGPITRPEESYRVWCVCDREAAIIRGPGLLGAVAPWRNYYYYYYYYYYYCGCCCCLCRLTCASL